MLKRRYERREPTHDWQQIKPLLKDTAQFNYEVIRPVVLWVKHLRSEAQKQASPLGPYTIVPIFLIKQE